MEVAAVYNQFHKVLLGFIKSKVNNTQDAEDILQNVFVKVTTGLSDLSRKEKLQSWIYAIARNAIIDYYRKKSGNTIHAADEVDLSEGFTDEEYNDTTKGLDCCLMGFVQQLPEEYRDLLVDVDLRGIKQKDLGGKYGLAYPTVRSRVQRGREKLRQILLACCHVEWDNRGNVLNVQSRSSCGNVGGSCKN